VYDTSGPLEKRIERYYGQQELPKDVLADLKEQIGSPRQQKILDRAPEKSAAGRVVPGWIENFFGTGYKLQPIPLFAIIIFCIFLAGYLLPIQTNYERLELVAAEIALNHAKQFDAEFSTPNIASLVGIMTLLDFAPVHPQRMQLETYHIMGARYCTIGNSIAVQIHLEDDLESAYTLYEFRTPSALKIEEITVINVGDIEVTLWHEGEVAMGLAQRLRN